MRARPSHPGVADLSRLVRRLGGEVRRHLDTAPGFPIHHRVTAAQIARLRRQLRNPDPKARARAIAALRRRILGRPPSPPPWSNARPMNL